MGVRFSLKPEISAVTDYIFSPYLWGLYTCIVFTVLYFSRFGLTTAFRICFLPSSLFGFLFCAETGPIPVDFSGFFSFSVQSGNFFSCKIPCMNGIILKVFKKRVESNITV